jgi:hypothetical protein
MSGGGSVGDPGHGAPHQGGQPVVTPSTGGHAMAIQLRTPDLAVFEAIALAEGADAAAIIARHVAIVAVEVEARLVAAAASDQRDIPHPTVSSPCRCPASIGLPISRSVIDAGASAMGVAVQVDPAVAALLRAVAHAVDDADLAVVVGGIAAAEAGRIRVGRERWLDAVMAAASV